MAQTQKQVSKKTVGSYPFFSVVISLVLALFIIGLLVLTARQSQRLLSAIKSRFQLQVVLDQNVSPAATDSLKSVLASKPWIGRTTESNQPAVRFISKEAAAKIFIEETGEDFAGLLDDNPLHDAFEVRLSPNHTDKLAVEEISKGLMGLPHVKEVVYQADLLALINSNLTKIGLVLAGLMFVLVIGVALLINNTIRLAMFSQRFLIRSMQLVGATGWFIIKPFVWRALVQSTIASVIAWLLLSLLFQTGVSQVPELAVLSEPTDLAMVGLVQLGAGLMLGAGGAFWAVRRFLNMSLDQLY